MLNLEINFTDKKTIDQSFVRIAIDLFSNWELNINDKNYILTEIEFYLFKEGIHPDKSTHEHKIEKGHWRAHSQGLDISLGFDDKTYDGGILLRGIRTLDNSIKINGPRRVVTQIFEEFGLSTNPNTGLLLVHSKNPQRKIYRTHRTGITETNSPGFSKMKYNFFCDAENWDKKHYDKETMKKFIENPEQINT